MEQKKLVFVDISGFAHAAWHAYKESLGSDGRCYRVLHGVFSKLGHLSNEIEWDGIVCVLDNEQGSFYRKSIYPAYKQNRPEKDPDLMRQMQLLKDSLECSGLHVLQKNGIESDDLIGSLVRHSEKRGYFNFIVSHDKDLLQLVSLQTAMLRPLKNIPIGGARFNYVDQEGVEQLLGVQAEQVADFLALTGDTSDNIPGISGLGPKGAAKLLKEYGTVEGLLTHCEQIKGSLGEKLREQRELLKISKMLTSIKCDEYDPDLDQYLKRIKVNHLDWNMKKQQYGMPHWMGVWE